MTDDEVIKSLEQCTLTDTCKGCPIYHHTANCISGLKAAALELIKRQREEIERLSKAGTGGDVT